MNKYKRLTIWLPVIIAASIALGIFIGNHFVQIGKHRGYSYVSGNKINTILDIQDQHDPRHHQRAIC